MFKVCFSDIRYGQLQMENILKITVYWWKTSKEFRSYEPKESRIKKEGIKTDTGGERDIIRNIFEPLLEIYFFT